MKIKGLWTTEVPLDVKKLEFGPHVTLIRGDNGCGKTVLAELASLLGHVSVIPPFEKNRQRGGAAFATLEVVLTENDLAALESLESFLAGDAAQTEFRLADRSCQLSAGEVELIREAFTGIVLPLAKPSADSSIFVEFHHQTLDGGAANAPRKNDLKEILADEHLLQTRLAFCAYTGQPENPATPYFDCTGALRALIAWNRPHLTVSGTSAETWTLTPRFILSAAGMAPQPDDPKVASGKSFPGAAGYVNTDMYDFGAGLDIRESPKELRTQMTATLIDRLQVLSDIGSVETTPISDAVSAQPSQIFRVRRRAQIEARWKAVFDDTHALKTSLAMTDEHGVIHWSDDEIKRVEFVSSGENQAFFLLTYLENLHWHDSILIIDEPEIHLSLRSASKLMEQIMTVVEERHTQVVIITHLPHLYRNRSMETYDWEALSKDPHKCHMIHLSKTKDMIEVKSAAKALRQTSQDSHIQVLDLVANLQIAETSEMKVRNIWRQLLTLKSTSRPRSDC